MNMKYYSKKTTTFTIRMLTILMLFLYFNVCGPPEKLDYATVKGSGSVNQVSPNITILFNNPPDDTLIDNYLINLIYEAADDAANGRIPEHTHLDVCMYDFNRDLIIEALEYAISKNVHVRFVGDRRDTTSADPLLDEAMKPVNSTYYSSDPGYLDIAKALDSSPAYAVTGKKRENFPTDEGFDPRGDNMTDFNLININGIMHHKFVLIHKADGKYVYTGSTNASDNDILRNNNNSLVIKNDELYGHYKQQFEYMLGAPVVDAVDAVKAVIIDDILFTLNFAYPGKLSSKTHDHIVNTINEAAFNFYFMIFTFTHIDISNAMAAQNGLTRKGIFDTTQKELIPSTKYSTLKDIFECRLDGNENSDPAFSGGGAKLHHKVLILDRGYNTAKVVTGSSNWTVDANDNNDESVLIIQSRDAAEIYYREFEKRWAEAQ